MERDARFRLQRSNTGRPTSDDSAGQLAFLAVDAAGGSIEGEREFLPRAPGRTWVWVKRVSFVELAIFAGLLVVWLAPGLEGPTFVFGLAHGIGYVLLCLMLWIAILRREAPFWLFAATLTPFGPVGSVIGIEYIERRDMRPGRDA